MQSQKVGKSDRSSCTAICYLVQEHKLHKLSVGSKIKEKHPKYAAKPNKNKELCQ